MNTLAAGGAKRIFLYNWPTYLATWIGAVVVSALAWYGGRALLAFGGILAVVWSAVSLAVSYWIYDRSPLAEGSWVRDLLPGSVRTWASIDAGLDTEVALDGVISGTNIARLDIYDGVHVHAPSVERARAITPRAHRAVSCRATALTLDDASCDAIAVVFAAHEIRDRAAREAFFRELARALRDGGRALLVEHVRDVANFCAFGPGFLHFQSRREWLRLARLAGLRVAAETRVTPWVMALALEKRERKAA